MGQGMLYCAIKLFSIGFFSLGFFQTHWGKNSIFNPKIQFDFWPFLNFRTPKKSVFRIIGVWKLQLEVFLGSKNWVLPQCVQGVFCKSLWNAMIWKPKKVVLHRSWMILQIYNNDWLEIVVYTERTGTIEIEFVAKKIFFLQIFFSNFFMLRVFFFFDPMARLKRKSKNEKIVSFFCWKNLKFF